MNLQGGVLAPPFALVGLAGLGDAVATDGKILSRQLDTDVATPRLSAGNTCGATTHERVEYSA
ncbi:exported hypothetical protein [uncultured Desulfovibrio sp.]|uniref:Uncharacterized protein n=1 Tax=uncultured Desulfovibrio sp. TaxID=167968 RepID=A0A212JBT9_9BACT|nr:exported hypothetical protein [uncultured Desulfovibrio sp.]